MKEQDPTKQSISGAEELHHWVTGGFDSLVKELEAGHTERFLNYLSFSARFHHYSSRNKLLIWVQRPGATAVAGYHKWRELGYQVARDEHGIRILAPVYVKTKQEVEGKTIEGKALV